jgi:F0F1-type ATP synthase membrane subunit b/b'
VINLLILLFFVKKFLFDKIDAIIQKRQQEVDEATEAADKAAQEARAAKKEYEKKIELADEEKEQILSDIKKQGYEDGGTVPLSSRSRDMRTGGQSPCPHKESIWKI